MKDGRLIGEISSSNTGIETVGDCARICLQLPEYQCLSFNYDYGVSKLCEILISIEGADYSIAKVFIH